MNLPKFATSDAEDREGKQAIITMRLSIPSERQEAIREIVAVYERTGSIDQTAQYFNLADRRTIDRWRQKVPELDAAIQAARAKKRREKK